MKKLAFLILIILLIGCKKIEKIYLNDKYYNEGKFIEVKNIDNLKEETYILYTYNNYCTFNKPCEEIFKEYMGKYKIDFVSIPFEYFKTTALYNKIKYGPSIIIIKEGKIIAYLDPNKDIDKEKYQDTKAFEEWINKYIYVEK